MAAQSYDDLNQFHQFLGEKLRAGQRSLLPEDVLDEWRGLHPFPKAIDEDIAAIDEAMEDIKNGDCGMSFEEFDRELRSRQHSRS
jgi:hypothetical protein